MGDAEQLHVRSGREVMGMFQVKCEVCGTTADHKDRDGQMLCSNCALDKYKHEIRAKKIRKENNSVNNR